ncbi:hypothetical protein [Methanopyrus sp.]
MLESLILVLLTLPDGPDDPLKLLLEHPETLLAKGGGRGGGRGGGGGGKGGGKGARVSRTGEKEWSRLSRPERRKLFFRIMESQKEFRRVLEKSGVWKRYSKRERERLYHLYRGVRSYYHSVTARLMDTALVLMVCSLVAAKVGKKAESEKTELKVHTCGAIVLAFLGMITLGAMTESAVETFLPAVLRGESPQTISQTFYYHAVVMLELLVVAYVVVVILLARSTWRNLGARAVLPVSIALLPAAAGLWAARWGSWAAGRPGRYTWVSRFHSRWYSTSCYG